MLLDNHVTLAAVLKTTSQCFDKMGFEVQHVFLLLVVRNLNKLRWIA